VKPQFCHVGSLPQEQAVELMELSHQQLAKASAGFRAYRIAAAVWMQTVPYSRGWDAIYIEELARLAGIKDRRDARRAIQEAAQAGAIEWEPNRWIPPKGEKGRPSLVGLPGASKGGAQNPHLATSKGGAQNPHNKVMGVEVIAHNSPAGAGEQHSQLTGHRSSERSVEDWEAERPGIPRAQPEPDYDPAELARQIEAGLDAPAPPDSPAVAKALDRFGSTRG
jgi:hypothetical protein